jgi:hypothetical protein
MVAGQVVGFDQSPLVVLTPQAANRFSCHPLPPPLTWRDGRHDRRDSLYPHPLIRLGHAVAFEHLLPVGKHHFTLDGRLLIGRNVPPLPVDAHSQILIGLSSISHRQYASGLHRSAPGAITHEEPNRSPARRLSGDGTLISVVAGPRNHLLANRSLASRFQVTA